MFKVFVHIYILTYLPTPEIIGLERKQKQFLKLHGTMNKMGGWPNWYMKVCRLGIALALEAWVQAYKTYVLYSKEANHVERMINIHVSTFYVLIHQKKRKRIKCWYWNRFCKKGDNCTFHHDEGYSERDTSGG